VAQKSTPVAQKSTPKAKSEDVVVDLGAFTEDLEASIVNIASPIMKKDEPPAKRIKPTPLPQPQSVLSSNVSTFEQHFHENGKITSPKFYKMAQIDVQFLVI
jgi:hypothetical protein